MMEGEPATRLPDEETSFVGRKVEAPRRRQRRQQAKKKRIAVLGVSVVTMLAFGAVCAFLAMPSGPSEAVKAAVSQAMESDPASATATGVVVPSFAAYDEDGDGKVSLGEYLDRLAINRDAALKRVEDSELDGDEKERISDLLNEDFSKHSDCVALVAQQDEDEMMTKENFDKVYEEITTGFCPMGDDRIPEEYQLTETAPAEDELSPTEVDPDLANSASEEAASSEVASESAAPPRDEAEWKPEKPSPPPRPVSIEEAKAEEGLGGAQWNPNYPTNPPIPAPTLSDDNQESAWAPEEPTESPTVAATVTEDEESASASQEAQGHPSNGVGDGEWNPEYPTGPPSPSSGKEAQQNELPGFGEITGTQFNPEATAYQSPLGETAPAEEPQAGAYPYTGAEMTTYGESTGTQSNPTAAAFESPFAEKTPEGQEAGTFNTYTGAATDAGAFNTFTSAETTTYGETQSNPEAVAYKSALAEEGHEGEQQVGGYYANNGENAGTQSNPEAAAYKSTFQTAPEEGQQEGAHNMNTGAATESGLYTGAQTNPETTAFKSPFTEKLPEEQQAGALNSYTESTTYGETTRSESNPETTAYTTADTTADTEKIPKNEQEADALNSYTNAGTTTNTEGSPGESSPKNAEQPSGAYSKYNQDYYKNAAANAKTTTGAETTSAGTPYSANNPRVNEYSVQQPTGAYNQGYYSAANNANAYNQGFYSGNNGATNNANTYNQAYYSARTSATNNVGAYNAYTGAGATTYGGGMQTTGAYNGYNAYNGYAGAATNAGTYKSYTGAGATTYGESKGKRQLRES